jgi:hypothetical protein
MLQSKTTEKPSVAQVIAAAEKIRGKAGVEVTSPFLTYKYGERIERLLDKGGIQRAILEKVECLKGDVKHESSNLGKALMEPLSIILAAKHNYPGEKYLAHFEEGDRMYVFEVDINKSNMIYPFELSLYNVSEQGEKQLSISLYRSYGNGADQEPLLALYMLAHVLNFGGKMDSVLAKIGKMLGLEEETRAEQEKKPDLRGPQYFC